MVDSDILRGYGNDKPELSNIFVDAFRLIIRMNIPDLKHDVTARLALVKPEVWNLDNLANSDVRAKIYKIVNNVVLRAQKLST